MSKNFHGCEGDDVVSPEDEIRSLEAGMFRAEREGTAGWSHQRIKTLQTQVAQSIPKPAAHNVKGVWDY